MLEDSTFASTDFTAVWGSSTCYGDHAKRFGINLGRDGEGGTSFVVSRRTSVAENFSESQVWIGDWQKVLVQGFLFRMFRIIHGLLRCTFFSFLRSHYPRFPFLVSSFVGLEALSRSKWIVFLRFPPERTVESTGFRQVWELDLPLESLPMCSSGLSMRKVSSLLIKPNHPLTEES
jgi:hypothetical protein